MENAAVIQKMNRRLRDGQTTPLKVARLPAICSIPWRVHQKRNTPYQDVAEEQSRRRRSKRLLPLPPAELSFPSELERRSLTQEYFICIVSAQKSRRFYSKLRWFSV